MWRILATVRRHVRAARHIGRLTIFWMRLQRILVDFVKQCGDLPWPRLLVWRLVSDWRAVQPLLRPQRALDELLPNAEQRALGRIYQRLDQLCRRHRPLVHPLTSPAAIRLQAACAKMVLGRWFQLTDLAPTQLTVLGRYGDLAPMLRDLLAHVGAPIELATFRKLRLEFGSYVRWAEVQLGRPDVCEAAHAKREDFMREIHRRVVRDLVPQTLVEKEVQRMARNQIALAMFWQASSVLLDRIVARSHTVSDAWTEEVDAAWQLATQRLQGSLNRVVDFP